MRQTGATTSTTSNGQNGSSNNSDNLPFAKPPIHGAGNGARRASFSATAAGSENIAPATAGQLSGPGDDPFPDNDAVIDVDAGANDKDPLGFNKPVLSVPLLINRPKPHRQLPDSSSALPDGHGENVQQAVVQEVLSERIYGLESKPAFHELRFASEAVALHSHRSSRHVVNSYISSADDSLDAMFGHDGLMRPGRLPMSVDNLAQIARREMDEILRTSTSGGKQDSSSLPAWLSGATTLPALARAAATIVTKPLGDPCESTPIRMAASTPFYDEATGSYSSRMSSVGGSSFDEGAVPAREYALLQELRAADLQEGMAAGVSAQVLAAAADPLPAIRIARPLTGNAVELALAGVEPAILQVEVAGVAFRDHPLFSREDYLATGLKGLYTEYARRMRANRVAPLDATLRSLLSYTLTNAGPALSTPGPGYMSHGGAVRRVYDFESDSLTELCARVSAVLEALSARHEDVTGASEVMVKLWSRWCDLQSVRASTGMTLTRIRLDMREVTQLPYGMEDGVAVPAPALHPILYATACMLDRLNVLATEEQAALTEEGLGQAHVQHEGLDSVAIAHRLIDAGSKMLTRIADGEQKYGKGYGCGGLGSGVGHLPGVLTRPGMPVEYPFPGAREWVARLLHDEQVTPDESPAVHKLEKQRRAMVRATWLCTEVLVNGRLVARSAPAQLHLPDFTAPAAVSASIRLYRRPASVAVRVCDVSSLFSSLVGATILSEVLVPIPGHANLRRGNGIDVGGAGDGEEGVATVPTSAMEPVGGVFEFSCTQPMADPYYSPQDPTRAEVQAAAIAQEEASGGLRGRLVGWGLAAPAASSTNGGPASALPLMAGNAPAAGSGFTHTRLTCGFVGVTAAWQAPERSEGTGVAGNGASSQSTSLVPVPALDSGALLGGLTVVSGLRSSVLTLLGRVTGLGGRGGDSTSLHATTDSNVVRGGSPFGNPQGERKTHQRGASRLGDARLLSELAALPVPKALATPGELGMTSRMALTSGQAAAMGSTAGSLSNTAMLVAAHALRRSQMLAAAEASIEATREGLTSSAIPQSGLDPNDPRAALTMAARMGKKAGSRTTRFRVTALARCLALGGQGVGPAASLGFGFGYGMTDLAGGALGALVPLPGKQRQQLLRLRSERPDMFRDLHEPIPLADEEIGESLALRELLRSALMSLGYSAQTADALQYGPLAYLRQGAKALGMKMEDGGEALSTRGTSASEVAKARLLSKVRDFLARVRASPLGKLRYKRRMLYAMLVKELSLNTSKAVLLDFNRLIAFFGPRRALRPLAIDFGQAGVSSAPSQNMNLPLPLLASPSSNFGQYRITIQIVRARNVPLRRGYIPSSSRAGAGGYSVAGTPGQMASPAAMTPASPGLSTTMLSGQNGFVADEPCMSVVEARFQGKACRSSASVGSNPQWNEVISLPFLPPGNDVSPARLADVEDVLTLSLFDEVAQEGRVDDRDKLTTVVRRTRRYIGSAAIPFVSLYTNGGSMAAEIRLETPPVNLGYRAPAVVHVGASTLSGPGGATRLGGPSGNGAQAQGQHGGGAAALGLSSSVSVTISDPVGQLAVAEANRRSVHLYVHISIDPPLPSTEDDEDDEEVDDGQRGRGGHDDSQLAALRTLRNDNLSFEDKKLLEYAARWGDKHSAQRERPGNGATAALALAGSSSSFSVSLDRGSAGTMRTCKAIVSNIVGEPVLMLRYLCPQAPPPDTAAAVAAHMQAQLQAAEGMGASGVGLRTPSKQRGSGIAGTESKQGEEDATAVVASADGEQTLDTAGPLPTVSPLVPRMSSPDAVIRYVSLVPFMADTHAFGRHSAGADLWATSQECLDMGAGDSEEHAIMLHNFLTWLEAQGQGGAAPVPGSMSSSMGSGSSGWRSAIVQGRGHPEGDTVYVLRQNNSTVPSTCILVNAVTGKSYLVSDDTCPLLAVGCVATQGQAWANIQPFCEPWRISWDLDDPRCWAPMFTPQRPYPGPNALPPVQTPLVYRVPDTRLAAALESELTTALAAALRAWRPRYVTRIRGDVSGALRPLLLELEARAAGMSGSAVLPASEGLLQVYPGGHVAPVSVSSSGAVILPPGPRPGDRGAVGLPASALTGARDLSAEHGAILERLASRYRPYGFPLNTSFTDLEAVIGAVKATGIHRIEDEAVQYALSVAVVPYPNDILSVWVYAVALLPAQA